MKLTDLSPLLLLLALFHAISATISATNCGIPDSEEYCFGTRYNSSLVSKYPCGDSRLGPARLPTKHDEEPVARVVGAILSDYNPFGGLCPGAFLEAWTNATNGRWKYPPHNGFKLTWEPLDVMILPVGSLLDRFGDEGGKFLSPVGVQYRERAIPPGNLATRDADSAYPYNYHVYTVIKPLRVLSGRIEPWFGQPGDGVQYKLDDDITVWSLVEDRYLQPENALVRLP
ncbi:uncharacterized protein C8A04DRAFT_32409 [Dichotomopilus funicola]|uniref:TNT domain-containing protein n=1 Tax=Dichotomopilus funicola TaxID=1934379 RepID=A0AAN6UWA1_9PEZI|nr:hypothetical protein C8A04DRAFT_32409 [Dichotomopilus funicola]